MKRALPVLFVVLLVAAAAPAAAQKKVLRIHTAGPNDTNVDNTMLAVTFANNVNAAADTVDVKVFPASQLGQTREVIEAMRLGSGAAGTTGGPGGVRLVREAPRRARPAVHVEELRPRDRGARRPGRQGARPATWRRRASRCWPGR